MDFPGVSPSPSPGPLGSYDPAMLMPVDSGDPIYFVALGAIFVFGFALLILATWYSARRARR